MSNFKPKYLTTKQLPDVTGLSTSYFEKGRVYGYGPPFIRITSTTRSGKILYDPLEVQAWLDAQWYDPEGLTDG